MCHGYGENMELSMIKKISPIPSLLKRGNKEMPTKFSDEQYSILYITKIGIV